MSELILKKCDECGALVKVLKDCSDMSCCGKEMRTLIPNSVDAAIEKHVPTYEVKDDMIFVTVNHVMEEEHYIEWICIVRDGKECITYLKPGMEAKACCKYVPGSVIYAYCNKHGLWKKDVE